MKNEAEDLDAKVHSHVKAKSAVKVPKEETSPMGKLKAEALKLLSTLKASNVTNGTRVKKASENPGVHSQPPSSPISVTMTTSKVTSNDSVPMAAKSNS